MRRLKYLIFLFLGLTGCDGTIINVLPGPAGGDAAGAVASFFAQAASVGTFTQQTSLNVVTTCNQTAFNDVCSSGSQSAQYTGCKIGNTSYTFTGTVGLNFSSATCVFAAVNDTITRVTQIARQSQPNQTINSSSASYTDYTGTAIGGGIKFTKTGTGTGFDLNGLGMRKYTTNAFGTLVQDVSIRTTTNIPVTDPTAATITFNGGVIEAADNVNKLKATYAPSNVVVTYGSCCYPTSGTLTVNYTLGTLTGTATVTFGTPCGSILVVQNGAGGSASLMGCN